MPSECNCLRGGIASLAAIGFARRFGVLLLSAAALRILRRAAEALPLGPESRTALTALGDSLQGDEESVCKALTLAGKILEKNLAAARDHRQETEKRSAALWLSSAALLVILLI